MRLHLQIPPLIFCLALMMPAAASGEDISGGDKRPQVTATFTQNVFGERREEQPLPQIRATRHMRAGTIISPSDIETVDGSDNAAAMKQFIGKEIKSTIYAGRVITPEIAGLPTIIKRNSVVSVEFVKGPLLITTEGRALEAGAIGDTIRVMNMSSKIVLSATIVGANKVQTR